MFDVAELIKAGGLPLIALIVFAESGMLVGFFLPGDTLLFSAGLFAAQGVLPGGIGVVVAVIALAAIAGDNIGYTIGKRIGPRLFRKKDGLIFRHDYIMKAEKFYEKYGSRAMLLAHFVPIVRTFAPIVAGVGKMNHFKFFVFDAIGDTAWATSVTLLGYWLGQRVTNIEQYIMPVFLAVILLAFGPSIYHLLKDEKFRVFLKSKLSFIKRKDSKDSSKA